MRDWIWANTSQSYFVAMTQLGNAASQRVLLKIGMVGIGQRVLDGVPCEFFRLNRP